MRLLAILEGKKPGAITLVRMLRGASPRARLSNVSYEEGYKKGENKTHLRARCVTAALEVEYERADVGPACTVKLATEEVITTREGSSTVALFCNKGANLFRVSIIRGY